MQSDTFGWVGLDNLTDRSEVGRTEDGEDRRQRRRSVRADGVRILWRGNTWRIGMRASTCDGAGLEVDRAWGGLIIYHGVMLKVELESEDSTWLMEGLRRKSTESRSLISGKARGTLVGLELRVREIRGTRHRSGMTGGICSGA